MTNEELITKFYSAFAQGDYQTMNSCYHKEIVFKDPAFGKLSGDKAGKMWEMLLSSSKSTPKISFSNVKATNETGSANWIAEYNYGPKKRKVVNHISAQFRFEDGKIIEHTDEFNLWTWSKQALGPIGFVLGWSGFIKNKVNKIANGRLEEFINKPSN